MNSPVKVGKKLINILLIGLSIIFTIVGIWNIRNYLLTKKNENLLPSEQVCDHCNILLFDIDILRADELPCYGYSQNTTPNICNFAKNSVVFKDNYSTHFWTLPSMFSTVTSLYPVFSRVRTTVDVLPPTTFTLAESLKKQGYRTVFVGQDGNAYALINNANGGLRYYDYVTTDEIEKVITDLSKSKQPWFIHYYRGDLHLPYLLEDGQKPISNITAPVNFPITRTEFDLQLSEYLKKNKKTIFTPKALIEYKSSIFNTNVGSTELAQLFYGLTYDINDSGNYLYDSWILTEKCYLNYIDVKKASDLAYVRMMYDSVLYNFDARNNLFLKELDSGNLSKNTITIIMSDHGESFGEHGTFSHDNNHYSELFYTPLIIHAPNLSPQQVNRTTSNMDIFPTILNLIGQKIPEGLQGNSLVPYFSNADYDPGVFSYSENYGGIILQNKEWLYYLPSHISDISGSELYDRTIDPLEKTNVYLRHPELTRLLFNKASLFKSYDNTLENIGITNPDYSSVKLDPEKVERLKKEGYF